MSERFNATSLPDDDPEGEADVPLTDDEFARGRAAMLARQAREATGLSQVAFAERYNLPLATVRDWEQGRRLPDAGSRAYLQVIRRIPEDVARALT
ncbi:helix-turn-helix domain-containing protein [Caenispirillum bisanense]|uniref:helix-turn-helix domain-containing protein n=1 Tax=Caenispirillum bisanense TaxID=414052 RepID=UPI0031D38DB7